MDSETMIDLDSGPGFLPIPAHDASVKCSDSRRTGDLAPHRAGDPERPCEHRLAGVAVHAAAHVPGASPDPAEPPEVLRRRRRRRGRVDGGPPAAPEARAVERVAEPWAREV